MNRDTRERSLPRRAIRSSAIPVGKDLDAWSTTGVDPSCRFQQWAAVVRDQQLDWQLTTAVDESTFSACVVSRRSAGRRVSEIVSAPFRGVDPQVGDGDLVGVSLALRGRMRCDYAGGSFVLAPGDLFVWDSTLARSFEGLDDRHEICLLVPRDSLPRSLVEWLPQSRPVSTISGSGLPAVVAAQLEALVRELPTLGDDELAAGLRAVASTLAAALVPSSGATPGENAAVLLEVKQHILQRLDDPRLCATTIAAAHGFSVRSLHLLFAGSGTTVAQWTRGQRLARCREELAAAAGGQNVTDIAFRWGFSDAAHFSRSFKKEFGAPPSTYLQRARARA